MALKNDIMFALKEIQKFNRNLIDLNDLITTVAAHLSIQQTKNNLDQIKDHLMASTDEDGHIPVDADLMRELLKLVETSKISKRRAGAELKQKLNGKRSDGFGK